MASIRISPDRLQQIQTARKQRKLAIDSPQWLIDASEILNPGTETKEVSIGTWKRFLRGKPVRKEFFQAFCQILGFEWQDMAATPQITPLITNYDLSQAPDSPIFVNRSVEMATLKQWIVKDQVRLISLLGMGGIGKTSLAAKIAAEVAGEFDYVIWRSLLSAPSVEKIISDWIKLFSHHRAIELPNTLEEQITALIARLHDSRCLMILDNAESILPSGSNQDLHSPLLNSYGKLFSKIGGYAHQSCLIITSREQFSELRQLQGESLPVRVMKLTGLQQEAVEIFNARGVFGSSVEINRLIELYEGNPFILGTIADTIKTVFNNSIADFLHAPILYSGVESLLRSQFDRLSKLEQSLVYWLAIHREPVTIDILAEDILGESLVNIIPALNSLLDRSLILSTRSGFTLQNVMIEYVSDRLIRQVARELQERQFDLFETHSIVRATSPDYIRETQQRLLLKPIVDLLIKNRQIDKHLRSIINDYQQESLGAYTERAGYAIGNIINILVALQIDLTGYDFSHLPIYQAYLHGVNLWNVNFSYCRFDRSLFSQSLGSIFTVAFSPDRQHLATGGMDGQIRIWQVADGKQILAWKAHSDWIRHVSFSEDGQTIASTSNDTTVKIWDWQKTDCIKVLRGHKDWVWAARFVTWKGLRFLISVSSDRTGKIWHIDLGKCLFTFHEPDDLIWAVAFSNNGYTIAASSAKHVKLWNIWTRKYIRTLSDNAIRIRALAFSPDGKIIAGSDDTTIKIWEVESGECLEIFRLAENSSVWSLVFSPNGDKLISAGTDKIQIWDTRNWEPLTTLSQPQHRIRSIAYSPDKELMAVGSDDQLIRIWDTNNSQSKITLAGVSNRIWTLAISPLQTSGIVYLASGSDDGQIRIWNGKTGKLLQTLSGHNGRIRSLAFSPSGKLLVSASHDRTIKLWACNSAIASFTNDRIADDIAAFEYLKTWRGHTDWVWAVSFGADERTIISAADDRTILVWDTHTDESQLLSDLETEWIWSMATHPHLPLLAVAGSSPNIVFRHLHHKTIYATLIGHSHRIRSIVFNPTGDRLASSSDDLMIKIWDVNTHQCLMTLKGHTKEIRALIFIPSSANMPELLVSASDDLTLRVWDPNTRACIGILNGHDRGIWALSYSSALHILYSCSQDETIKLWNLDTCESIDTLKLPQPYQGMNINQISGLSIAAQNTLMALGAISSS